MMKMQFIARDEISEFSVSAPQPSKNLLPKWYADTPRYSGSEKGPIFQNGEIINNSVKACVPFYDSVTAGYIQTTWCDIHIKFDYENNLLKKFNYNFSLPTDIMNHRGDKSINLSDDFHPVEFVWKVPWMPILPTGWSALFVSPLNRLDLPIHSLSGIIDSDIFYHALNGNYPFYIKKSFNDFIIPAGTPMYQIIPIKRENWKSEIKNISNKERIILHNKIRSSFIGSYKRFFNQKKKYA